jgi:hypothetical protein
MSGVTNGTTPTHQVTTTTGATETTTVPSGASAVSKSSTGNRSNGSSPRTTMAPTPIPVLTTTPTTVAESAYIYQGDGGFCTAVNSIARAGLNPANCVVSSSLQQCALNFHGLCGTNEAYTGILGAYGTTPNGAAAVQSFMSTSTASMLTQSGIAFNGQFVMTIYVGIAWNPPSAVSGGGFVAVIGVCAGDAHNLPVCP